MQKKTLSKLFIGLSLAGCLVGTAGLSQASGFQLWEQNGAGTGDYHAGGAAEANDASTAWYNPAGLTRLKKMQVVVGAAVVQTHIPYRGTVEVNSINPGAPQNVHVQGGVLAPIPFGYFAMPINDKWAWGFGVVAPFGLSTKYGSSTLLKFVATTTSVQVIDLTPNIAYQVNKVMSMGAGLDVQHLSGEFDQYGGLATGKGNADTKSDNSGGDWAIGGHFGMLFQFTPNTRFGWAYHTQVVHQMSGTSKFTGLLAHNEMRQESKNLKARITLPAYMVLSGFHTFNKQWAILGSATYTQWSSFKNLILRNVASPDGNNTTVSVVEGYKNTWNFALGAHYTPVDKLTFKAGVGYDETPSNDADRNVQLPGQNRYALAFGVHYQIIKKLGVDVGYTHLFIQRARINNVQPVADEVVTTVGRSDSNANIYGVQLTWDV